MRVLMPEDPNPDEGWFLDSLGDGDEQDPAILICDPDFEIRLEIFDTENLKEDQALVQALRLWVLHPKSRKPDLGADRSGIEPSSDWSPKASYRRDTLSVLVPVVPAHARGSIEKASSHN